MLVLGEGQKDGFGDIGLNSEAKYMVNITKSKNKFILVFTTKQNYHFKAKDSVLKPYRMYLRNISKCFIVDNVIK